MGSTKIINVSRDDSFDEIRTLFDSTPAKEVIFILPKRSNAFSKDAHFSEIATIAKDTGKKIALMTSSPQVIAMGRAYKFDIITEGQSKKPSIISSDLPAKLVSAPDANITDDDDSVVVPSDEKIGTDEEKEDEEEDEIVSGMHIEEEEEHEQKEEIPDQLEELEAGHSVNETENEELPDNTDEEEEVEGFYAEDTTALSENEVPPGAQLAAVRNMDGMVRQPNGADKRVPVKSRKEKQTRVPVSKTPRDESLNELAKVWQTEQASSSLWKEVQKERSSSFWSTLGSRISNSAGSIRKMSPKKIIIWSSVLLAVVIFGVAAYPSSARIIIKPSAKNMEFSITVNATDAISSVDATFLKIPGQRFEIAHSVSGTFTPSGEKDAVQKSRGKITVVNSYSTTSQILIATTRFETPQGLIFRTLRTITVPGMTAKEPGKIDVEVIADQPGSAYNVPAGKFIISTFKEKGDTERVEKMYGESSEPMHGGIQGRSSVVTEKDYADASETIKIQLRTEMLEEIKNQAQGLVIPDAVQISIDQIKSTAGVDDAAESFTVTANGTVTLIGFRNKDLADLIKKYVDKKYGLDTVPEQIEITITSSTYIESEASQEMRVSISGDFYEHINSDKIESDLLGKKDAEIRAYFDTISEISSVRVKLLPFWVSRIPTNKNRVTVDILYEK